MGSGHDAAAAFIAPPLSCDAHFHVFGPLDRFPQDPGAYHPALSAPIDTYRDVADRIGISRFVLVQPAAYAADNACLLDALREIGPVAGRGVVVIGETRPADTTLAAWQSLGVRGIRVLSHQWTPVPGLAGGFRSQIKRAVSLARELSWHVDFLTPGWLAEEMMADFADLPVDFAIAHLGMLPWGQGPRYPAWQQLLGLLATPPRRCWLKLTGWYRSAASPAELAPFLTEALRVAPDRIVWGSDFPHISFSDTIDTVETFNTLADLVPDESTRHRILVDNPAELYGF